MIRNLNQNNWRHYVFCEFYGDGLPSIQSHLFASCHLLSISHQSAWILKHIIILWLQLTAVAFTILLQYNYQRELDGICHNPQLEFTLFLIPWIIKYCSCVIKKHGYLHYTAYLLSATQCHFIWNNSICSDKPQNQGF